MSLSIGELAKLSGVSIRTLHHYDEIGLLSPSHRSQAGYRRYEAAEVARLHQILVYRDLGFDLGRIALILDDSALDAMAHLRRQHALLRGEIERLMNKQKGVERMMEARKSGIQLTRDEMREVFGTFDPTEHEEEAKKRWGDTDAYKESQRRVATYDKEKWKEIGAEVEEIEARMAACLRDGLPPTSESAMNVSEEHRLHISRWFYECGYEIHRGLGEMYVADPRFARHYEDRLPGLSTYARDAIRANADRASG
jgi:DNA-binding transcriptional MerR regulator